MAFSRGESFNRLSTSVWYVPIFRQLDAVGHPCFLLSPPHGRLSPVVVELATPAPLRYCHKKPPTQPSIIDYNIALNLAMMSLSTRPFPPREGNSSSHPRYNAFRKLPPLFSLARSPAALPLIASKTPIDWSNTEITDS